MRAIFAIIAISWLIVTASAQEQASQYQKVSGLPIFSPTPTNPNLNLLYIIGGSVGGLLMIGLFLACCCFRKCRERCRRGHPQEVQQEDQSGKNRKEGSEQRMGEINHSDKDNYHSNDNAKDKCCICLQGYPPAKYPLYLSCGHGFHGECLNKWQHRYAYCPACQNHSPTNNIV